MSDQAATTQEAIWKRFVPYAAITIVGVITYGWTVSFKYVQFDDDHIIEHSQRYLSRPDSLIDAFMHPVIGGPPVYYRPLLVVSFVVDTLIAPGSPRFAHFTDLLLHLGVACLLLALLCRLAVRRELALVLSMLF